MKCILYVGFFVCVCEGRFGQIDFVFRHGEEDGAKNVKCFDHMA